MKKRHFALVFALLLAAYSMSCPAKKTQTPMQRIDQLIAKGDTITETGLHTPFVITGATVTPEMFESEKFVPIERVPFVDAPDSYLGIVMYHNGDVIACRKEFIDILFPHATKFVVDGQKVSRSEFNRIPASLLRTVAGEDKGKKLVITTCIDVDDPNPAYEADIKAEQEWFDKNQH